MAYRKLSTDSILIRKGMPADRLYILISGSTNLYDRNPKQQRGLRMEQARGERPRWKKAPRQPSVAEFKEMKPSDVLRAGSAIGSDELLMEDPKFGKTVIAAEVCELWRSIVPISIAS